jgi:hypothetical protein
VILQNGSPVRVELRMTTGEDPAVDTHSPIVGLLSGTTDQPDGALRDVVKWFLSSHMLDMTHIVFEPLEGQCAMLEVDDLGLIKAPRINRDVGWLVV